MNTVNEHYQAWEVEAPTTRDFDVEIVAQSYAMPEQSARLELWADETNYPDHGIHTTQCFLSIVVPTVAEMDQVGAHVRAAGLDWRTLKGNNYGTWRRYHLEVAKARLALEGLGWTLTAEEEAIMDALEEYGRRAPARYVTAA